LDEVGYLLFVAVIYEAVHQCNSDGFDFLTFEVSEDFIKRCCVEGFIFSAVSIYPTWYGSTKIAGYENRGVWFSMVPLVGSQTSPNLYCVPETLGGDKSYFGAFAFEHRVCSDG
tara:strand:- start:5302 stop:5643 length:342 start_codon:yes stop_codon:yes gene_type:complete